MNSFKSLFFLVSILSTGLTSAYAAVAKKPKAELGIIGGGQYLADYRGSREYHPHLLAAPFIVYRGDRLKIDRNGARGEISHGDNWAFNLSAEASLGGSDANNERRRGMTELGSAFELGPSLNINLSGRSLREGWSLRFPVRGVFVVDQGIAYQGYVFNPKFTYRVPRLAGGWRLSANLGAYYGSNRYHDYYYSVAADEQIATRLAYDADAGYSGFYSKIGLARRKGHWWSGFSLRYDNTSGAVFEPSPLVETEHYFSSTFAVAYFFWASKN